MKEKVTIINVCKYDNANGSGCRVGLIFNSKDKLQKTDKFLGFAEISQFYDSSVFDKIDISMIGVPVNANIEARPNPRNPLKINQVVTSIELNGNVINLL